MNCQNMLIIEKRVNPNYKLELENAPGHTLGMLDILELLSGISMLRPVPEWGLLLTTTLKTEWNLCAEACP